MFPQHRTFNRNAGTNHIIVDWWEPEHAMTEFLSNNRGTIAWEVTLAYDNINTARPASVSFSATFFDHNGQMEGIQRNCPGNQILPNGRCLGL